MRLQKERLAAGLSQLDLSRLSGVPQSTISKLEGGIILAPTFDTLDRLARALRRVGREVEAAQLQPRLRLIKRSRKLSGLTA